MAILNADTSMSYIFPPPATPAIPIHASSDWFPVHRIYCVGKNYAAHAREMGTDPTKEPPCFFQKPADAIVTGGVMPYPSVTRNMHYEGELVVAIGKGGADIAVSSALDHIYGYALGLDMTRRDLQTAAGSRGQPWDTGKAFDFSAPVSAVYPVTQVGHISSGRIQLWVNETLRQDADIGDLIWKCPVIISELSKLFVLQPGDLIFSGTPAGVGPVVAGDDIRLSIEKLGTLVTRIC
jgi:fumarylpyruvate hydrolase